MSNPRDLSDRNFREEVLESDLPVLVDFWAPWCGPCRAVGPVVEQLAVEHASSCKVVKLNVDSNPDVAAAYRVDSIPTLMIFKGGRVAARFVGVQSKETLKHALDQAVA